jgi:hypothetical protein
LPAIPGLPAPPLPLAPATAVVAPPQRPVAAVFRTLVALAAAAGVGIELLQGSPLHILSYFMIQTSVLVAVVFTPSASRAWTARRPLPPALTGGTLLYVSISALVYHLVLTRGSSTFVMTGAGSAGGDMSALTGWHAPANLLLHTVIPLAVVADWLLLTRPGPLRLTHATTWLLYPMAYLAFTLGRGALLADGSSAPYLYPFLDVDQHGYKSVLADALLLGLAFYALALTLVAADHLRPNPVRRRHGRRDRRPRRSRHHENRISSPATGGLK